MANAVRGVTEGFKKELDIVGVCYRAELKGKQVHFALGYSHPVVFDLPNGIDVTIDIALQGLGLLLHRLRQEEVLGHVD